MGAGRLVPSIVAKPFATLGAAAKNAVEVARLGGLETGEQPTPYRVLARDPMYRLRHYPPAEQSTEQPTGEAPPAEAPTDGPAGPPGDGGPPMLLVPPLMLTAEVYDV